MNKKMRKLHSDDEQAIKELTDALTEFMEGKPAPESNEEFMEQHQKFIKWYNNVRKQSDTGKTPKEMGRRMLKPRHDVYRDDDESRLHVPASRTCPECSQFGLEVMENPNKYECQICGSVWQRLRPINDGTGRMMKMPAKLKQLLKESEEAAK